MVNVVKKYSPIPVLMYHSVGRVMRDWQRSLLTIPAHVFEDHLKWLGKAGYKTTDLCQLRRHVSGEMSLDPRTVVLTFDDGYLDNWTYVVPLLKKYKFTATVFVNPDFVDHRDVLRATIEDVWAGKMNEDDVEVRGFMSWRELRTASADGTLSIQSHGMTHTSHAVSSEVVDFHHPGDGYYWLDWNANPVDKPFYLLNPSASKVPWGTPIYRHGKSLEGARYFPNHDETVHLAHYVRSHGGADFFCRKNWSYLLFEELRKVRASSSVLGRAENPSERNERLRFELLESKRRLEASLGVTVSSFCWPGGAYDDIAFRLAKQIYESISLGSRANHLSRNACGDDPSLISRRGAPYITHGRWLIYLGGRYLVWFLDEFRGVSFARQKRQSVKLVCAMATRLGIWPRGDRKIRRPRITHSSI